MSEQTYRNPLFGQRVDRYIPPELRQGLGAVLALGDMLNPVSAYREYIRDVREGDVIGGATNLAGFVAPGAAGAIASRLGRSGIRAIEPYSDDAARALMEMLSPTGAPEVSRGAEGMSRREFLAGLGAAAATPALPVDEMLSGLGRVGARGGVGLSGRLGALAGLRSGMSKITDEMRELDPNLKSHTLSREIDDLVSGNFDIDDYGKVLSQADISKMVDERRAEISRIQESLVDPGSRLADLRGDYSTARDDLLGSMVVDADEYIGELGELGDDELRSLASEMAQFFSNMGNVARLKRGGYDPSEIVSSMGRLGSALRDEVARRDLGEDVLGDVEFLVGEALPEVAFAYRIGPEPKSVRSGGVDEFGFVPDDFDVAPRMVGGVEDFGRGLGSVEIGVEDFGFRQDNPAVSRGATDWLANKQRIADEDYENFRGISGSITAELGQRRDSPMFLPTEFLRSLPGARGESRGPGDPRFDDLLATVRREGFDPEQAGNRVVVGVNHRGEAFIVEGNTRTAVADVVGIPSVKAEVRYFNGGEEVAGPFAPSSIARIAASRSD